MLAAYPPMTTIAVTDLDRARAFYEGVLGVRAPVQDTLDGVLYTAGGVTFLVYPSMSAGTNKATYMSFRVPRDAFDAEVDALRAAGVELQSFEMEGVTWTDGVASWGDERAVWFEDPDGNTLAIETA